MSRPHGCIHEHDPRDAKYQLHALKSHRVERYWDAPFILDQGDHESCVGEAWCGWTRLVTGHVLDPLGIYSLAGRYNLGDKFNLKDGTTVRNGAKVLKALGIIESYHVSHELAPIIYTLLEIGPMVAGTNWYSSMDEPPATGLIDVGGKLEGRHCYLLDGVNVNEALLRFRQSWSVKWGYRGHGYVRFGKFERLLKEDGEARMAVAADPRKLLAAREAA